MSDFGSNFVNAFGLGSQISLQNQKWQDEQDKVQQATQMLHGIAQTPSSYKDVDGDIKYIPMTQRLSQYLANNPNVRGDVAMDLVKNLESIDRTGFEQSKMAQLGEKFNAMQNPTPNDISRVVGSGMFAVGKAPSTDLLMKSAPDYQTTSVNQGLKGTTMIVSDKNKGQNPLEGQVAHFDTAQPVNVNLNNKVVLGALGSDGFKAMAELSKGISPEAQAKMNQQMMAATNKNDPKLLQITSTLWGRYNQAVNSGNDSAATQIMMQINQLDNYLAQNNSGLSTGIGKQSPRLQSLWQTKVANYGDYGSMENALKANGQEIWNAYLQEYGGNSQAAKDAFFNDWNYLKNNS